MFDKLSEMGIDQLRMVKDWYLKVYSFYNTLDPDPVMREYRSGYLTYVEELFEDKIMNGNKTAIKGFRMALNDLIDLCRDLNPEIRKKLNGILREKYGYDLNDADKKEAKKIDTILTRGGLRNDTEYYLVKEWVDHLLWTGVDGDEEKAQRLDELIGEYERRVRAKMERAAKKRKEGNADD